jgi:glycosyltransferase involved in cell wall biosynthesis
MIEEEDRYGQALSSQWLRCNRTTPDREQDDSHGQQPQVQQPQVRSGKGKHINPGVTGIDGGERRLSDALDAWLETEAGISHATTDGGAGHLARTVQHEQELQVFSQLYARLSTKYHAQLRKSVPPLPEAQDKTKGTEGDKTNRKRNLGPDLKYIASLGLVDEIGNGNNDGPITDRTNSKRAPPSISVVSSVYEKPGIVEIQALLLRWQRYPAAHFERIVCDDGSVPPTLPTGEAAPDVYLWHSKSRPPLEMARADQILLLADSGYNGGGPWARRTNHKIRSQNHCVFLARHPQLILLDDDVLPFSEQWAMAFASRLKQHAQVVVRGEYDFYRCSTRHPGIEMDAKHYVGQHRQGGEQQQNDQDGSDMNVSDSSSTFARFGSYRWFKHGQPDLGYFFPHNVGISKQVFEAVGGMDYAFDGTYAWEDLDFGNRLKEHGVIPQRQVLLSYEGYAVNVGWPHDGVVNDAPEEKQDVGGRATVVTADGKVGVVTERPKDNQRNERIYMHRWNAPGGELPRSVVVSRVIHGSAAAQAGLRFGDIMYALRSTASMSIACCA